MEERLNIEWAFLPPPQWDKKKRKINLAESNLAWAVTVARCHTTRMHWDVSDCMDIMGCLTFYTSIQYTSNSLKKLKKRNIINETQQYWYVLFFIKETGLYCHCLQNEYNLGQSLEETSISNSLLVKWQVLISYLNDAGI